MRHDGFLTAEQIYDRMHKVEKVSLSTVYRILTVFFENGIVSKSVRSDGIAYFGLKNEEHKHLLVCMSCKEAVEIDTCPLDELGTGFEQRDWVQDNRTQPGVHWNMF